MNQPFKSYHYTVEVVSPVFIGAAKENDYVEGQDYYYEADYYHFINTRKLMMLLNNHELDQYTKALISGNVSDACRIIKTVVSKHPHLLLFSSYVPYQKQSIVRKHIADGFGNLIIPGSSLKGAIAGVIGKYLMSKNYQNQWKNNDIFGGIQNNIMRFLQVGDTMFYGNGEVTCFKIFSADIERYDVNNIHGEGMWKHGRIGDHGYQFKSDGFVTAAEMISEGAISKCRINWADGLFNFIGEEKKHPNTKFYQYFQGNELIKLIKNHTKEYLLQEKKYFNKFPNDDFNDVEQVLDNLLTANDEPNAALIRLGSGSGFHAITGNWKYTDHTATGQAMNNRTRDLINAMQYKTRKVAFYPDGNDDIFTLPGFIKLTQQP